MTPVTNPTARRDGRPGAPATAARPRPHGDPVLMVCGDLSNLGDLALLAQNLEVARRDGRRALVRRYAPLPPEVEAQVMAAGGAFVDGRRPLAFLRAAWGRDVVIGGGQLVRDNVSLRALAILAAGIAAARAGGGRVTARGLGVGRLRDPARRRLWGAILGRCDRVAVRDAGSAAAARDLAPRAPVVLAADMAFLPSRLHGTIRGPNGPTDGTREDGLILVAPCLDPGEGRSMEGPGLAALLALAREAVGPGRAVLACHDPRPGMDGLAADRIAAGLPATPFDRLDGYALETLLAAYRGAALVVTNRLHATIFSLLSGAPVLVVADGTAKTREACEAFAIPSVDLTGPPDEAGLGAAVAAALGFDRAARAAALADASRRAELNLAPPPPSGAMA